jgi:F0F1-type ATP synthase assembly protein I
MSARLAARVLMLIAGLALTALGVTSAVTNRVTGHEALAGFAAILLGVGTALWLRRDKRKRGTS